MKSGWIGAIWLALWCFFPGLAGAQTANPTAADQNMPVDSLPANHDAIIAAPASVSTESSAPSDSSADRLSAQMIAFFDNLNKLMDAHKGNCAKMTEEFHGYCLDHQDWIDALAYASENASPETIEKIRTLAAEFGKKLSVCYDSEEIPMLLRRYAGITH